MSLPGCFWIVTCRKKEKILYLDGDTIVRDSLSECGRQIWRLVYWAAVLKRRWIKSRREIWEWKRFPYINAGVLLIDLKKVESRTDRKKDF